MAQGGIAAAMSAGDSIEKHLADTVAAGDGIVDEKIARLMVADAPARVHDLLEVGVPFDRDLEGHLAMSREAAHSERRVVHVRGDMAGGAIMAALVAAIHKTPSIRLHEGWIGESLELRGRSVTGLVARRREGGAPVRFPARAVVLASGGVGHLYAVTTNPPESEGGGLGMAALAGAVIADAEFVQFHPTALDVGRDPAPLATEALRGDGATLINRSGERFMLKVHPLAELAPRDIVARAIHAEIAAGAARSSIAARRSARRSPKVSDRLSLLPRRRDRPGARADPDSAGRALSHGRRADGCGRPHDRRRALGLRRDGLDGRAWRQPAGVELAARSGGLCGARGAMSGHACRRRRRATP